MTELLEIKIESSLPAGPWKKGYMMTCQRGHKVGKFKRDVDPAREPIRPTMIDFEPGQEVKDSREAFLCHVCSKPVLMPPIPNPAIARAEYVGDVRQLAEHASLEIICKDIGDYLFKTYPGWMWAIRPSQKQGMISIFCLQLSGHYSANIRISDVQNDARLKAAKRQAGELLERYGMPRGPLDAAKLAMIPRDFANNPIPDLGDKDKLSKSEKVSQLIRSKELKLYKLGEHRFARVGKGHADVNAEKQLIITGAGR